VRLPTRKSQESDDNLPPCLARRHRQAGMRCGGPCVPKSRMYYCYNDEGNVTNVVTGFALGAAGTPLSPP